MFFFGQLYWVKALNHRDILTVPSLMCPGHQAMAGSLMPPSKVVSFPQRNGPLLPPEELEAPKHMYYTTHTGQDASRTERLLLSGPDMRAAPLSEVKKTSVFFSMPRLRSEDRI